MLQFKQRMASIDREIDTGDNDTAELPAEVPAEQDIVEDESAANVAGSNLVCDVVMLTVASQGV